MPRGRPVDPEKRALVIRLHTDGLSRNEIARQTGVSQATVSKIVAETGGAFDRAATKAATAAHKVDLAAKRALIHEKLLRRAEEFLDQMDQPFTAINFGGKDNTFASQVLERPTTQAIKDLMTSVGIAIQRSNEIAKLDADPHGGMSAVDDWLQHMTGGAGAIPTPVREVADSDLPINSED